MVSRPRAAYISPMSRLIADHPYLPGLFAAGVSIAALAAAFASEHWGGLAPCVLCIYQRYAYGGAILAGLAALGLARNRGFRKVATALAGFAFLTGAGIAFFHVGVEQLWWRGTEACQAPGFEAGMSIADMRKQLMETEVVACDQVPWSFLGISIAGFNVLASLAFAAVSFWWVAAMGRNREERVTA